MLPLDIKAFRCPFPLHHRSAMLRNQKTIGLSHSMLRLSRYLTADDFHITKPVREPNYVAGGLNLQSASRLDLRPLCDSNQGLLDIFSVPACCASWRILCYNERKLFPVVWRCCDGFFPLYIKLMLGPLSEDLSRIILAVLGRPGKDFFLLTARPIKKDRASLACSWTRLTIRGSCFEHRGIRTQGSRISFV